METKFDARKIQEDIKKIKEFIKAIKAVGGSMSFLEQAVNKLEIAVNTGIDIASAAKETSDELKKYTDNLYKACDEVPEEEKYVCLAEIDRKWQARSVNWVLSWDNPHSVARNSVMKIIIRYRPQFICTSLGMLCSETN